MIRRLWQYLFPRAHPDFPRIYLSITYRDGIWEWSCRECARDGLWEHHSATDLSLVLRARIHHLNAWH